MTKRLTLNNRKKIAIIFGLFIINVIGFLIYIFVKINALASFSIDDSLSWRTNVSKSVELPATLGFESNSKKTIDHQWKIYNVNGGDTSYFETRNFEMTFLETGEYVVYLKAIGKDGDDEETKTLTLSLSDNYKKGLITRFETAFNQHFDKSSGLDNDGFEKSTVGIIDSNLIDISYFDENGKSLTPNELLNKIAKERFDRIEFDEYIFNEKGEITNVNIKLIFPKKEKPGTSPKGGSTGGDIIVQPPHPEVERDEIQSFFTVSKSIVNVGELIVFTNQSKFSKTYEWDFDADGKVDSKEESPSFKYGKSAKYKVVLKSFNEIGDHQSFSNDIEVLPELNISIAIIKEAKINELVKFASTSPGNEILNYSWTFGDGTSSKEKNPSHQFKNIGKYNIKLECTDKYGRVGKQTAKIQIKVPVEVFTKQLTSIARLCSQQACSEAKKESKHFLNKYFAANSTIPVFENDMFQIGDTGMDVFLRKLTIKKKTKNVKVEQVIVSKITYDDNDGKINGVYLEVKYEDG
jgi:PKD repeat protein